MNDRDCLIALCSFPELGTKRVTLLLDFFKTPTKVWRLRWSDLTNVGISNKLADSFVRYRDDFDFKKFDQKLADGKISAVTVLDRNFPKNLQGIGGIPLTLFIKGKILKQDEKAVSIVGSRVCSPYGVKVAESFSSSLSKNGVTIVSGLARGIDTVAHKSALKSGGRTIAVLGSGINRIYPPENRELYEQIIESGAVVSEYPFSYPPYPENFVARNRIVTGLSKVLLVVEGRQKSGTLTSAAFAADQGKTVVTVPGSIYSDGSYVPNMLIKNGAKVALNSGDVLEELK